MQDLRFSQGPELGVTQYSLPCSFPFPVIDAPFRMRPLLSNKLTASEVLRGLRFERRASRKIFFAFHTMLLSVLFEASILDAPSIISSNRGKRLRDDYYSMSL